MYFRNLDIGKNGHGKNKFSSLLISVVMTQLNEHVHYKLSHFLSQYIFIILFILYKSHNIVTVLSQCCDDIVHNIVNFHLSNMSCTYIYVGSKITFINAVKCLQKFKGNIGKNV